MQLWAPSDAAFAWRLEPGGDEELARRKQRPGKPIIVAQLSACLGGGKVYIGRLSGLSMNASRDGVNVWVRQSLCDGGVCVRRIHQTEVQRLFCSAHTFRSPGQGAAEDCLSQQVAYGSLTPWSQLLGAVAAFFAVPCPRVPASIDEVISKEHLEAYRGGLAMAAHDYDAHARRMGSQKSDTLISAACQGVGTTSLPKAEAVNAAGLGGAGIARAPQRRLRRPTTAQPEGGLVFDGILWPPMYLADFFVSGDVRDIVPMQNVLNEGRVVRGPALLALAGWYPDQEAVVALAGGGVPSKDRFEPGVAVLGTNHVASVENAAFVNKMYATELDAGRMSKFGIAQSPPCWPIKVSPTGCVDKALRNGDIDPDNKRPTADYSWPPAGHWMWNLCRSPNESVDLERDFPFVYMIGAHDLIEQIQYLAALGDGVR